MYRFPDPLDDAALKTLIADKRFQDPLHPEHEFFKKFVSKAFELVHPDPPRNAAGQAVIDPRDPPRPRVVKGGSAFMPDGGSVPGAPRRGQYGAFETVKHGVKAGREERKTGIADFFPADDSVGALTWPVSGRRMRNDGRGAGHFGPNIRNGRAHQGVDIEAPAGATVVSPISGRILRGLNVYDDSAEMRGLIVVGDDGRVARIFYVDAGPAGQPGARVKAGQAIGRVQDVSGFHNQPEKSKMTNHVHLEIWKRKDGTAASPRDFRSIERERDYTVRDPWPSLQLSSE